MSIIISFSEFQMRNKYVYKSFVCVDTYDNIFLERKKVVYKIYVLLSDVKNFQSFIFFGSNPVNLPKKAKY